MAIAKAGHRGEALGIAPVKPDLEGREPVRRVGQGRDQGRGEGGGSAQDGHLDLAPRRFGPGREVVHGVRT